MDKKVDYHPNLFFYQSTVKSVVDGDTVRVLVDCGFKIFLDLRVRLDYIDAPEINTEEGKKVKEWLENKVLDKVILIKTKSIDKYGRWLSTIWQFSIENPVIENSINIEMIKQKLVKPLGIPKSLYKILNI